MCPSQWVCLRSLKHSHCAIRKQTRAPTSSNKMQGYPPCFDISTNKKKTAFNVMSSDRTLLQTDSLVILRFPFAMQLARRPFQSLRPNIPKFSHTSSTKQFRNQMLLVVQSWCSRCLALSASSWKPYSRTSGDSVDLHESACTKRQIDRWGK